MKKYSALGNIIHIKLKIIINKQYLKEHLNN